jgi:2-polyprenylphenol 6-hydroxylase
MNKVFDVVVVGAAHANYSVAVVGGNALPYVPNEAQPWDARVFALSRRSQQLLADLRVWDALSADRKQAVIAMEIWGDHAKAPGSLAFQAGGSGLSELTWIVEQQALNDALHTALQFFPRVHKLAGHVLDVAVQEGRWQVRAEFEGVGDGAAALPVVQVFEASMVVAADGGSSQIRQCAGMDFPIHSYGASACVSTFKIDKPHLNTARQWFIDGSVLALLPLPGAYVSMVWSVPDAFSDELKRLTPEQLAQRVCNAHSLVSELYGRLQPAGALFTFPLRHGIASEWVRFEQGACIALMGDAAHLVHPLAGQGLNLGLEDVAALREMVLNTSGLLKPLLWRKWQRHRKVAVRPVHAMTNALFHVFQLNVVGSQWARNAGMQWLDRMSVVKRWLIAQAMR